MGGRYHARRRGAKRGPLKVERQVVLVLEAAARGLQSLAVHVPGHERMVWYQQRRRLGMRARCGPGVVEGARLPHPIGHVSVPRPAGAVRRARLPPAVTKQRK